MSEIDWNVELRKASREFDGLPPESSPAEVRARVAAEREEQRKQDAVGNAVVTWVRLLLVVSLAVALKYWPYARACGPGLFAYVAAEVVILVGALWVVTCTWRYRMAKTHAFAMMLMLGALGLLEMEILPRVGYAKVSVTNPVTVWCADWRPLGK
jgi:cytochrome bd-type quinol oxidase subunit 2